MRPGLSRFLPTLLLPLLCSGSARAEDEKIAARVGEETITEGELQAEVRLRFADAGPHGKPTPGALMVARAEELARLIDIRLLLKEAGRRNIHADPKEIDRLIAESAEKRGGMDKLEKALQAKQSSLAALRTAFVGLKTIQALLDAELGDKTVTREQARAYFDSNQDQFRTPASYRLRYVQLSLDGKDPAASKRDGEAKAKAILGELRKGLPFEGIEKKHPEATFKDLGWGPEGSLPPGLESAVRKLAPGQWSEPVGTGQGLHLLGLLERKPSQVLPFEDVAEAIIQNRTNALRDEVRAKLLEECRKRWKVVVTPGPELPAGHGPMPHPASQPASRPAQ